MTGLPGGLPVGLSVSPASTRHNPASITVTDIGASKLQVSVSTLILHEHCAAVTTSGVHVSRSLFMLSPGQARTVHVRVPEARGDYGILFTSRPLAGHGNAVATSVGAQILTGTAVNCVPVKQALPAGNTGIPLAPVIGAMIAVLLVALAVWAYLLRRRHHAPDDPPPSRWGGN